MEELTEAVLQSNLNVTMKSLAVSVFNAYMEAERNQFIQAQAYERVDQRVDQRNGYYERELLIPQGKIKLRVPRTRSGEFKTELFDHYQRCDKAFVLTLMEMVVQGISTRKVTEVVEQLCGEAVSKSFVSDLMKQLDPEVAAFQQRSLAEQTYAYLHLDALYIKVREHGRVVSKAVYLAQGTTPEPKREIIGFMVSDVESKQTWQTFLLALRQRGLRNPQLITSDAHAGLKKAIDAVFTGVPWQRCTFHFLRNLMEVLPKQQYKELRFLLRRIFKAPTREHALLAKRECEAMYMNDPKLKRLFELLEEGFEDAIQYVHVPEAYHAMVRTSSSLERLNREIRRRDKVFSIYPNLASATRLIGAVLIDLNQKMVEKRPFNIFKQGSPTNVDIIA
ncbi:IS256 family transposase [Aerococcaceae bacterium NML191219]|nr:IS256 family transposase [Aerococcaceae bacterium NML191219]